MNYKKKSKLNPKLAVRKKNLEWREIIYRTVGSSVRHY